MDPANSAVKQLQKFEGLDLMFEDDAAFLHRLETFIPYNVIHVNSETVLEPLLPCIGCRGFFPWDISNL